MYENITYALLLNRMLEKALSINNNLDTREGSLVWLGNAPPPWNFKTCISSLIPS